MEFVTGLFMAGGGEAAIAGAVGKAGAAAATSSSFLTALQGGLTAASAIMSIGSGLASRAEARTQSQILEMDARSEATASEARALEIRKKTIATLAEQRVAFAGSGVDISTGTPEALARGTQEESDYQLQIERENGRIRALKSRLQASAASSRGDAALLTGIGGAVKAGAGYAIDIAKRG